MQIKVYIQPKASKSEVVGFHGDAGDDVIKIRIQAPPVDGKANEELCKFLSKLLKIPKTKIKIIRGKSSRKKTLEIEDLTEDQIKKKLPINQGE